MTFVNKLSVLCNTESQNNSYTLQGFKLSPLALTIVSGKS